MTSLPQWARLSRRALSAYIRSMFTTLTSFAKPQPDTVAAAFLLRKFGEEKFPGISTAKAEFWTRLPVGATWESLEEQGIILIDLGGGRFDHHRTQENGKPQQCATELVAAELGLTDDPALKKLIAYARRDDLEGKGTVSSDPLDRAFGLSGLLTNLNKAYSDDLAGVTGIVLAMFGAHYQEEENRTKIMPTEWRRLTLSGEALQWAHPHKQESLRVAQLRSDNSGFPGFLKAYHKFDIVIIRRTTGHVNIITSQSKDIDLAPVAAWIRGMTMQHKGVDAISSHTLHAPGKIDEVPEWYYDTAANTLQNGGVRPEGIEPTVLNDEQIAQALRKGLQS